jgi:hypothetical protein
VTTADGRSVLWHPAAEEDLRLDELAVPHSDELGIAVTFPGLQLVLVQDEHTFRAYADELQDLLGYEAVRGRETAFQEFRLADVIILRAGENEILREKPLGPFLNPARGRRRTTRERYPCPA